MLRYKEEKIGYETTLKDKQELLKNLIENNYHKISMKNENWFSWETLVREKHVF